jgi:predicted metal-dependent peptidase
MSILDLNDPVVEAIVKARVNLLFNAPFFGNLATRMRLIDGSKWCNTAATDGRNLYYNREFIKSLDEKQLLFLIAHEVLHAVYDHLGRRGSRDPKIYNMAADYIINYTLVKEEIGVMPKMGLYDTKYSDEMTSEEVYRLLEENSVEIKMPLDMHLDLGNDGKDENGEGDSEGTSVRVFGDGDGPPKLTEEDMQKIRNEVKAAVINTAQALGAGKVPAGVRRLIEAFTNPIMDWRELLEMHIQSSLKDDYTFQRPSKRTWSTGRVGKGKICIMPGQKFLDTIDIAIAIDMSGSMTDDMVQDMLNEVKGIMDTFSDFKLTLWTFDHAVYNPQVFTGENIDELMTYDAKGGGGTSFDINWEFMKDPSKFGFGDEFPAPIEPKKFCMFTDGLTGDGWGQEEYCDVLWILHGTTSIVPPYGLHAYYDESRRKA